MKTMNGVRIIEHVVGHCGCISGHNRVMPNRIPLFSHDFIDLFPFNRHISPNFTRFMSFLAILGILLIYWGFWAIFDTPILTDFYSFLSILAHFSISWHVLYFYSVFSLFSGIVFL